MSFLKGFLMVESISYHFENTILETLACLTV